MTFTEAGGVNTPYLLASPLSTQMKLLWSISKVMSVPAALRIVYSLDSLSMSLILHVSSIMASALKPQYMS